MADEVAVVVDAPVESVEPVEEAPVEAPEAEAVEAPADEAPESVRDEADEASEEAPAPQVPSHPSLADLIRALDPSYVEGVTPLWEYDIRTDGRGQPVEVLFASPR